RLEEELARLPAEDRKELRKVAEGSEIQVTFTLTSIVRSFFSQAPGAILRKVRVPVLAVCGARDVVVTPRENLAGVAAALKAGGNRDFTTRELPGLNHHFQTCKTGRYSEYALIKETFAPAALEAISGWVLTRTKGG